MKILISADMEGITGVVHWDQVDPGHAEYPRFRRLMTGDVNAAIRGAFEAGAKEVLVTDGHAYGRNILIEELDPRAHLNSSSISPLSMVQGIDSGVDGVIFVGYHARIGTQNAILEHTWSDERVYNLYLNGDLFGEIGLNAGISGHFGAPVIMISGDRAACTEAAALLGEVETAVVKVASGRMAAECLPPAVAQEKIQIAARKAVTRLNKGQAPKPLHISPPITMIIDFVQSEMADRAALLPGASRNGRHLVYTAEEMVTIYRAFRTALALARG
ncbi:MAG: M55 family metallopeptidase [Anaerolineales bacterium]|nr:M55 family metallopeptidase [Anaerolineales bacterium]